MRWDNLCSSGSCGIRHTHTQALLLGTELKTTALGKLLGAWLRAGWGHPVHGRDNPVDGEDAALLDWIKMSEELGDIQGLLAETDHKADPWQTLRPGGGRPRGPAPSLGFEGLPLELVTAGYDERLAGDLGASRGWRDL